VLEHLQDFLRNHADELTLRLATAFNGNTFLITDRTVDYSDIYSVGKILLNQKLSQIFWFLWPQVYLSQ
jgi:hypothetical protein